MHKFTPPNQWDYFRWMWPSYMKHVPQQHYNIIIIIDFLKGWFISSHRHENKDSFRLYLKWIFCLCIHPKQWPNDKIIDFLPFLSLLFYSLLSWPEQCQILGVQNCHEAPKTTESSLLWVFYLPTLFGWTSKMMVLIHCLFLINAFLCFISPHYHGTPRWLT